MAGLHQLRAELLHDRKITEDEVAVIRDYIHRDGKLDMEDVKFLVGLLSDADEVCAGFDGLFFPALKEVILADGRIGLDEQFYLLKMLYSKGHVRDSEKQFLAELRDELTEITPEFETLCDVAFGTDSKNWSVGGTAR